MKIYKKKEESSFLDSGKIMDNNKKELVTTLFMLCIAFLFSVFMLVFSFTIENIENYEITTGYLISYKEVNNSDQTMYNLVYSYTVNENEYTVSSSGESGILPRINSPRPIKYNPNNPEEAYIPSLSLKFLFSFLGILGIIVTSIAFMIETKKIIKYGKLKTIINLFLGFIPGVLMIFLGYIITYIATGYFSFIKMFTYYTNSMLIPLLFAVAFIIVGMVSIIMPIFKYFKNKYLRKGN